jgi:4-alpha-glucanotransferase
MRKYVGKERVTVNDFIAEIMKSVADTVVIPMQDYLGLGNDARMNHPSVTFGNWTWRLTEDQLTNELSDKILDMTEFYDRKA